jgi:chromosome segregation ATPase
MNLTDMKAKLKDRADLIKEVWPYLRHPYKIAQLKDAAQYWRDRVAENSVEALRDAHVQALKEELADRKKAYDEAEAQWDANFDELERDYETSLHSYEGHVDRLRAEILDLNDKLSDAYAEIAVCNADRAAALAEAAYLRALSTWDNDCACEKTRG